MEPQIIQILELADKNFKMISLICQRKQSKMNKSYERIESTKQVAILELKMYNDISEIKNLLDGFDSRLVTAEDRISELQKKIIESIQLAQREKRM